ncbi:hypothetical protein KM043_003610 [Ampulex compressa]|nr:hypothetical protein KM043_003610 [Ampulex compressa]
MKCWGKRAKVVHGGVDEEGGSGAPSKKTEERSRGTKTKGNDNDGPFFTSGSKSSSCIQRCLFERTRVHIGQPKEEVEEEEEEEEEGE